MLYRLWTKRRIVAEDWQPTQIIGIPSGGGIEQKSFTDYEWRPLNNKSDVHLGQLEIELGILLYDSLFRSATIRQLPQVRGFTLILAEYVQAEDVFGAIQPHETSILLTISKLPGFDKVTNSYIKIGGKWSRELVAYFRPEVKANVDELPSPKCERAFDSGNQVGGGGDDGLDTTKEPTRTSPNPPTVSDQSGTST